MVRVSITTTATPRLEIRVNTPSYVISYKGKLAEVDAVIIIH